jgi:WD40 repeat protein
VRPSLPPSFLPSFLQTRLSFGLHDEHFLYPEFVGRNAKCSTDFIITTSVDGHLKLWKKQDTGIEFVKHYRAHIMPIVGVSASADGQLFASIAEDESAKVFDVVNFGEYSGVLAGRRCCIL